MAPTLPITDDVPVERQPLDSRQNSESDDEPLLVWLDDAETAALNLDQYEMLSPGSSADIVWINTSDESDDGFGPEDSVIHVHVGPSYTLHNVEVEQTSVAAPAVSPPPLPPLPPPPPESNEMDPEHIERIKAVMKNITIPSSNLPSWTAVVPEEEWKTVLLQKISTLSTNGQKASTSDNERLSEGASTSGVDVQIKLEEETESSSAECTSSNSETDDKCQNNEDQCQVND